MELHANFAEDWYIFDNNFSNQIEFIITEVRFLRWLLKDKQLVLFLLIHDQIFPADDSHPILIEWFLDSYDHIGLSCFGLKKSDRKGSYLLIGFIV